MNYKLHPEEQAGTIYFSNNGVPDSITFGTGEEAMLRAILACIRCEPGDDDATLADIEDSLDLLAETTEIERNN
jgi:hypothetical protein